MNKEYNMSTNSKPFTCYFCNKLIKHESESNHISICGSVLEPCPNKCGSYIQRSMKTNHMQECINRRHNTLPRLIKQKHVEQVDTPSSPTNSTGSNSFNGIPSMQNTTIYKDNLNIISNKFFMLEQTLTQLQKIVDTIRSRQEQLQSKTGEYENSKLQMEKLLYQNQMLLEWRKNADLQLNSLNHQVSHNANSKVEYEKKWLSVIDERMMLLQEIRSDLNNHKDNFLKDQLYNRETQNELQLQLKKVETFYTQESAAICALWSDQGKQIDNLRENINNLISNFEDQKLKHSTIVFDLRALSQVSSESAEKLEIQERELKELKKSFIQLKLEVEMLEESNNNRHHMLPGHIIWKISDFTLKMETAKSNNFILKSPIFYSDNYGYKIRLLIYLNGIKKWKGRHLIACLDVMKGEYDLMLPWPCHMEGNVIIRDLEDHNSTKHITKFITAKRQHAREETEEPQESSSQYIFVTHSQLLKSNYVKEDTMFIEVKINKNRKYQEETSL